MTQRNATTGHRLTIGDFVGFEVTTGDVDSTDYVVWCEIKEVTKQDGFRAFRVSFPDGSEKRTPVLAKHVRFLKLGLPKSECVCGQLLSDNLTSKDCLKCGRELFTF